MVAMLTKQERAEIAERFRNYDKAEYVTLYSGMYDGLLGEHVPKETTVKKDRMELASRILDPCDTSNMLELPLDKDGEVIHINDVVYDSSGEEYQVECIKFFDIGAGVAIRNDDDYTITQPGRITHKNPVTAKSLAQRIKHVLEDEAASIGVNPYVELGRIAEQLESLGDSDD